MREDKAIVTLVYLPWGREQFLKHLEGQRIAFTYVVKLCALYSICCCYFREIMIEDTERTIPTPEDACSVVEQIERGILDINRLEARTSPGVSEHPR